MTQNEMTQIVAYIADAWPRWEATPARLGMLWNRFSKFTVKQTEVAFSKFYAETPNSYAPNIDRIQEILAPLNAQREMTFEESLAAVYRPVLMKSQPDMEQFWHNATADDVLDEYDAEAKRRAWRQGRKATRFDMSRPWMTPLTDEENAKSEAWKKRGATITSLFKTPKLGKSEHIDFLHGKINAMRAVVHKYQSGEPVSDEELTAVKCPRAEATA